jgi:DNA-binding IclR family transcriptional regulator
LYGRRDVPSGNGLSSVDNALRLLQLIGERRVLRVADAADELRVARSTAHRLLGALRQRGFVLQDKPNGPYRAGPALNEAGLAAIGRIDIRRVARPVLEELRDATRETVSLLLLESNDVRFVDWVEGPQPVRVGSRTGIVAPAHCTSGGKAILAGLSPAELSRRYPSRELEARTSKSLRSWARLEVELDAIRTAGFAVNIQESTIGVSAVGAAIRDLVGAPLAAIAVAVPTSRMPTAADGDAIVPLLKSAQGAITELLSAEL